MQVFQDSWRGLYTTQEKQSISSLSSRSTAFVQLHQCLCILAWSLSWVNSTTSCAYLGKGAQEHVTSMKQRLVRFVKILWRICWRTKRTKLPFSMLAFRLRLDFNNRKHIFSNITLQTRVHVSRSSTCCYKGSLLWADPWVLLSSFEKNFQSTKNQFKVLF